MSCASATPFPAILPAISCHAPAVRIQRPGSVTISWRAALLAGTAAISTILARRRQRLALRELDDHLLRDIGLSRAEAGREASKPLWR
jgi:uncharacterized protein YjiS (DUF1127 family)